MPIVTGAEHSVTDLARNVTRPLFKQKPGTVTADVEAADIADGAVAAAALADGAVTSGKLGAASVTCTALADGHVTSGKLGASSVTCTALAAGHVLSEKASSNLRMNHILLFYGEASSSEAAGAAIHESTARAYWRPRINVNVLNIKHIAMGLHENATCDDYTLYGNNGTCIGHVPLKTVSTGIARGTVTPGTGLNLVALTACSDVLIKLFTSTCSVPGRAVIQIDY